LSSGRLERPTRVFSTTSETKHGAYLEHRSERHFPGGGPNSVGENFDRKFPSLRWLLWLYHLIDRELKRRQPLIKRNMTEEVSRPGRQTLSENAVRPETVDASPLAGQFVPKKDALLQVEQDMRNWPREERQVFELYFVEGLEPEEIAMVTQQSLKTVQKNLAAVQQRLRERVMEQEAVA
jgi:hypothetical protein